MKTRPPAGNALTQQPGRIPPKFSVPTFRVKSRYPTVAERNSSRYYEPANCPQPYDRLKLHGRSSPVNRSSRPG